MAFEAVVCHDSSQVGMASEENAVEVVHFALVPVCAVKETSNTRHRGSLVGVGLDTNARVVADGQKVVYDLEAVVAGGIVAASDAADLRELGRCVI